jgi:nitroimidazol reductase NimA-like FMN-containing flavoprotein (pyridoxamine 5'-phosphate oxidase superfamily)
MDVQNVIEKIKELVKKGNVSRIVVCRKGQQVLNIPVSVGAVGAVVGLAAAKWVTLAAVLATIGLGCTVEVIKSDGGIVNVMDEESNQKVRNFAADAVEKVKENIPVSISVDIKRDDDVVDAEVEEVHETDENK